MTCVSIPFDAIKSDFENARYDVFNKVSIPFDAIKSNDKFVKRD